jgi:hypothetical protein
VVIAGERSLDQAAGLDFESADFFENLGCFLGVFVIPSRAKRSRGIPLHYREALIDRTAYISENKSRHSKMYTK